MSRWRGGDRTESAPATRAAHRRQEAEGPPKATDGTYTEDAALRILRAVGVVLDPKVLRSFDVLLVPPPRLKGRGAPRRYCQEHIGQATVIHAFLKTGLTVGDIRPLFRPREYLAESYHDAARRVCGHYEIALRAARFAAGLVHVGLTECFPPARPGQESDGLRLNRHGHGHASDSVDSLFSVRHLLHVLDHTGAEVARLLDDLAPLFQDDLDVAVHEQEPEDHALSQARMYGMAYGQHKERSRQGDRNALAWAAEFHRGRLLGERAEAIRQDQPASPDPHEEEDDAHGTVA